MIPSSVVRSQKEPGVSLSKLIPASLDLVAARVSAAKLTSAVPGSPEGRWVSTFQEAIADRRHVERDSAESPQVKQIMFGTLRYLRQSRILVSKLQLADPLHELITGRNCGDCVECKLRSTWPAYGSSGARRRATVSYQSVFAS